jgi:hypothetical protein
MTVLGIVAAIAVYLLTESIGWAIVGLFASGMMAKCGARSTERRRPVPNTGMSEARPWRIRRVDGR